MLKDSFGRRHTYLRISLTDRCNLSCKYCVPPGGYKPVDRKLILRPEEIERLVRIFTAEGVRKVRLTGGEPLIRRCIDAILEMLSPLQSTIRFAITTNGLLLAEWLDPLVEAGVRRINISLDTLSPSRYRMITGVDGWQQVWDGIELSIKHPGVEIVKLNVVLQKGVNDDEVVEFARLTRRYPIDVRFIELMPVKQVQWRSSDLLSGREVLSLLPDLKEAEPGKDDTRGPARIYSFADAPGRIGLISSVSQPACAFCNRLRITAQGMLLSCLYNSEGLDLRQALRGGLSNEEIIQDVKDFLAKKRKIGTVPVHDIETVCHRPCIAAVGG